LNYETTIKQERRVPMPPVCAATFGPRDRKLKGVICSAAAQGGYSGLIGEALQLGPLENAREFLGWCKV
jgi:hypothetical protein